MGYCSRSQAAALIREGRVAVNGRMIRDPENPVQIGRDQIEVGGSAIAELPQVYLVMNKPRGVVTTASDEKGRMTVYDLLDPTLPWLGPVGRLDKASEGLLLLTNDSEWAAKITDPASHLDKTYHVQVDRVADDGLLAKITRGATVDGDRLRVKAARVLRRGEKHSWLEVILDEGKNRHIRRLLEALDVQVLRLVRVAVGPLALGDLTKGAVRALAVREKEAVDRALLG
ncbi:MAG: rRNA pseudouridine synthase [Acidobacteriia bacterium]|nr:rRNA pseudouridine synthase [Terriglobia bacterium]